VRELAISPVVRSLERAFKSEHQLSSHTKLNEGVNLKLAQICVHRPSRIEPQSEGKVGTTASVNSATAPYLYASQSAP